MSAFGNEIPLTYRLTAAAVLAWLTCQGRLLDAWLYSRLVWDWAEGVEERPAGYFAHLLGSHRHTTRTGLAKLEADGILSVSKHGTKVRIMLIFEGVVRHLYGENFDNVVKTLTSHDGESFDILDDLVKTWELPVKLEPRPVSGGYVTVYDTGALFGTILALTTTTYRLGTYVYGVVNYNYLYTDVSLSMAKISTVESFDKPANAVALGSSPKRKVRKRGTGQPIVPKTSNDFRRVPLDQARQDSWWSVIEALHREWCEYLGLTYAMSTFRYTAWRLALVEAGYTPEQLRSALPALKRDQWWVDKCGDPHVMFAQNPGKIERFFPANVKTVPDRLGRGTDSTNESFKF